jgi:hypothetical protein
VCIVDTERELVRAMVRSGWGKLSALTCHGEKLASAVSTAVVVAFRVGATSLQDCIISGSAIFHPRFSPIAIKSTSGANCLATGSSADQYMTDRSTDQH